MASVIFSFTLCIILFIEGLNAVSYSSMDCFENQGPVNDVSEDINVNEHGYFLSKIKHGGDGFAFGQYRFMYCKGHLSDSFSLGATRQLAKTYSGGWTRSCTGLNNGKAAMTGVVKRTHNNDIYEDKEWVFTCAALPFNKDLTDCSWIQQQNACPYNGVIRQIQFYSFNGGKTKRYECCRVINVEPNFKNIQGSWVKLSTFLGGDSQTYSVTVGTERSMERSNTKSISEAFGVTVEQGFEYDIFGGGGSTSVSVGYEYSATTERAIANSLTTSTGETFEYECAKSYVFQFVLSGTEVIGASSGTISTKGNIFLCTNQDNPKCPPPFCSDDDCQTCTNSFVPPNGNSPLAWHNVPYVENVHSCFDISQREVGWGEMVGGLACKYCGCNLAKSEAMVGMYKGKGFSLEAIDQLSCAKPGNGVYNINTDCTIVDISESFNGGYHAHCPTGMVLVGIFINRYGNDGDKLRNIEGLKCCKYKDENGNDYVYYGHNTWVDFISVFQSNEGGWVDVPTNTFFSGLQRNYGETLYDMNGGWYVRLQKTGSSTAN